MTLISPASSRWWSRHRPAGRVSAANSSSALRWARPRGARQAWLQVLADNTGAIALYESTGFRTAYSYAYWQREERA